ncbi:MAG: MBL fold metallo-hydrolase [Dactylosporangium sp.]|nr:MBL fold metallo-hydrolase [Dactylosporangium sp.]NNJ62565.1 MBL fold metallo-hydrolase [Dactylosporangium sp.]
MRLTVLGCAGSFPSAYAPCSAYLIEVAGFRLMLDFGTGALSTLQRVVGLYSIDAILLSHLHADHIFDACSYVVARRYAPGGSKRRLPVYAPLSAPERLAAAYGGASHEGALDDVYTFHTLRPGMFSIGPFAVTVDRVNHPVETFGVRIECQGHSIAYSADTAPCDTLLRLAHGVDLFLCEASYPDGVVNPPGLHLTGREAGEYATKAGVGQLLLTHLVPAWCDEEQTLEAASAAFAGQIIVVRPEDSFIL